MKRLKVRLATTQSGDSVDNRLRYYTTLHQGGPFALSSSRERLIEPLESLNTVTRLTDGEAGLLILFPRLNLGVLIRPRLRPGAAIRE